MNVREALIAMGGPMQIADECGLTLGRVSQWQMTNYIPRAWLALLKERYPSIKWSTLKMAKSEAEGRKALKPEKEVKRQAKIVALQQKLESLRQS
jgi:hypothetical protein